jgi:putative transposase
MRRASKFLLRPTKKQQAALDACLEDTRQLYNAALEERREAWRMGCYRVTFYDQDAQLKEIRAGDAAVRALGLQLRAGCDSSPGPCLPGLLPAR